MARSPNDPFLRAGLKVRILFAPAKSLLRTSLSGRIPSENRRSESSPLEATAQRTRRWHLDEMVVPIARKRMYLSRAVDHEGEILDISAH